MSFNSIGGVNRNTPKKRQIFVVTVYKEKQKLFVTVHGNFYRKKLKSELVTN
jgi:hypothetical protein